jgi:hypothetical protein
VTDALEVVHQHALLGHDLLRLLQMLQHAAGAHSEVRAARLHALRRGLQHLHRARLVEVAALAGLLGHHHLARQRAGNEGDLAALAVAAGDAAAIVAEVEDFGLEGGLVEAGAGSGHLATGCGQKMAGYCRRKRTGAWPARLQPRPAWLKMPGQLTWRQPS